MHDVAAFLIKLIIAIVLGGGLIALGVGEIRRKSQQRAIDTARVFTWTELLCLEPTDFEHAVGTVLRRFGYELEHNGRSNDRGADLVGQDPTGAPVIVQCKRYAPTRTVGSPELREFIGSMAVCGVSRGVYVTTAGSFTRHAIAQAGPNILLLDGPTFSELASAQIGR